MRGKLREIGRREKYDWWVALIHTHEAVNNIPKGIKKWWIWETKQNKAIANQWEQRIGT